MRTTRSSQLAPDGKIYIATGNSSLHLHVIHDPDEPGLACNMEQHRVGLPTVWVNSLPNHPNYHLGPVVGSPCDTLGYRWQGSISRVHST